MQLLAKLILEIWPKMTKITKKWSKMAFFQHFLVIWTTLKSKIGYRSGVQLKEEVKSHRLAHKSRSEPDGKVRPNT